MNATPAAQLRAACLQQCSRDRWGECAATAVLLGPRVLGGHTLIQPHVRETYVDWDQALTEPWSSGELVLVQTAAALWHGRGMVGLGQVPSLDEMFYAAWQALIAAGRTGRVPAGW